MKHFLLTSTFHPCKSGNTQCAKLDLSYSDLYDNTACTINLWFFQYLTEASKKDQNELSSRACCNRRRGDGVKLKAGRFKLDIRKKTFTMRVVKDRNRLPREAEDLPSLETFKVRVGGAQMSLLIAGEAGLDDL